MANHHPLPCLFVPKRELWRMKQWSIVLCQHGRWGRKSQIRCSNTFYRSYFCMVLSKLSNGYSDTQPASFFITSFDLYTPLALRVLGLCAANELQSWIIVLPSYCSQTNLVHFYTTDIVSHFRRFSLKIEIQFFQVLSNDPRPFKAKPVAKPRCPRSFHHLCIGDPRRWDFDPACRPAKKGLRSLSHAESH